MRCGRGGSDESVKGGGRQRDEARKDRGTRKK